MVHWSQWIGSPFFPFSDRQMTDKDPPASVEEMSVLIKEVLALISEVARANKEHTDNIAQLRTLQSKITMLVSTMAHDYARIVEVQSARLDALEAWKFGASEPPARARAN
jgi:hypothetical protein